MNSMYSYRYLIENSGKCSYWYYTKCDCLRCKGSYIWVNRNNYNSYYQSIDTSTFRMKIIIKPYVVGIPIVYTK